MGSYAQDGIIVLMCIVTSNCGVTWTVGFHLMGVISIIGLGPLRFIPLWQNTY